MTSPMRRLAHEQSGISLPELLLSMVLMLIVLGATLATFTNFESDSARSAARNESQDAVRRNVGQMTKELRNLASPNPTAPQVVERAQAADLVFQTVDPVGPASVDNPGNVRRMRYCLEGGSPARLWMQWMTPAPGVPVDTACPGVGSAWEGQQVVAQGVTNQAAPNRPVFTYDPPTDITAVSAVNVDLFVDMDPLRPPGETRLRSGAFLRNQNRAPTAAFTWSKAAAGKVVLNGSPSSDPEGQPLTYVWMSSQVGGVPTKLGEGITCECPTNKRLTPGTYKLWLEVKDPGGLSTKSADPDQSVVIS
jgi:type II secretory pathway pseudopilin PulG